MLQYHCILGKIICQFQNSPNLVSMVKKYISLKHPKNDSLNNIKLQQHFSSIGTCKISHYYLNHSTHSNQLIDKID